LKRSVQAAFEGMDGFPGPIFVSMFLVRVSSASSTPSVPVS
jgi:hypothetical protein